MKEFVVKTANDEEVNNLQHRQSCGKYTQGPADRGLSRSTRRNERSRTRQFLLAFQKVTQELTVSARTTAVLPRQGVRFGGTKSPEWWACLVADRKSTDGMVSGVNNSAV